MFLNSCSKDEEEVRTPSDILGVWSLSDSSYTVFKDNYVADHLQIDFEGEEAIGTWSLGLYVYEPGYNIVLYFDESQSTGAVFQIVEMTSDTFTWCWVKNVTLNSWESMGEVLGEIINEAQEGFNLNPELYQRWNKIPENEFKKMLDGYGIKSN